VQAQSQNLRASLVDLAYAKNTVKNNMSAVSLYQKHVPGGPFAIWSDESIVEWIMHGLFNLKWKKSTLKTRLGAMGWYFTVILQRKWDDSPGSFVDLLKKVIKRLGSDAQPKLPIKADKLMNIMQLLDTDKWDPAVRADLERACPLWRKDRPRAVAECAAWFALSFACFFRASETEKLEWKDINAEVEEGVIAKIQVSLCTSQFVVQKTSATTVHLVVERIAAAEGTRQLCTVARLSKLIVVRKGAVEGKLFSITVEQARKVLQVLAATVFGKPASSFGLHSLRSGAACTADEAGKGIARIMFMGRWRSAAVLAYLRGDADGASALLLRGNRQGAGTAAGEIRQLH
jgi:integrase